MTKINFSDLVKIFGASYATDKMTRYMSTELYNLHKLRKSTDLSEEEMRRMGQLQNDPNSFVFAMELDDREWNIAPPSRKLHLETGPLKDTTGQYIVKCPMGEFQMDTGDYIFLTTEHRDDINSIETMGRVQFEKGFRRSENK